jgi:membrane-bound lytic murein transglycosylase D
MSSDEFIALNAAFPRKLIRSDTPVNLLVPVDKTDTFQRNLKTGSWDSWQPYPAQKGERPATLARRFDTSLARLEEHNQLHTKNGKLVRAQTILVPAKGRDVIAARTRKPVQPVHYTVKRGDTLHAIAQRFDISLGNLKAWNPVFRKSSKIRTGQAVVVRKP